MQKTKNCGITTKGVTCMYREYQKEEKETEAT